MKKFVPSIYLFNNNIVKNKTDLTPIDSSIEELVRFYGDVNADELMVVDLSTEDDQKEEALLLLKQIAACSEIPVVATNNIKRTEDVKKLLYAGARKVILNLSKTSNWEMLEEVSKRFGSDKIAVTMEEFETFSIYRQQIEKYASELVVFGGIKVADVITLSPVPCLFCVSGVSLEKLLEIFEYENLSGLFGGIINENAGEINALKALCAEKGIEVNSLSPSIAWEDFKLNSEGLIPVIAQDYKTGEVLMMAYMNKEAYEMTMKTGKMNYYSRSRQKQWEKGETSGHFQYVKVLMADCDKDTILAKISQIGPACHTGLRSCFYQKIASKPYEDTNPLKVFEDVYAVIEDRKVNPKEGSYTNYLFDKGIDKILKKLGEEASEIIIASKNPETNEIKYEISDFLYHMMVLMVEKGISWEEITKELAQR